MPIRCAVSHPSAASSEVIAMKFSSYIFFIAAAICSAGAANSAEIIGFFSPYGVPAEVVKKTDFAMINVQSVEQLSKSLSSAKGHNFAVHLDFELLLSDIKPASRLNRTFVTPDGKTHQKRLTAMADNKIRVLPANKEIRLRLAPYIPAMKLHEENIGAIFLVDEPYLNGISKKELERAGAEIKRFLASHGISNSKLGVIFASGMFNREFATKIDRSAGAYAFTIDNHHRNGGKNLAPAEKKEWNSWKAAIKTGRLTTYDSAGNMFIGGGIPKGYDVVAFDFYLSTILLDGVHEKTLDWLSMRYPEKCGVFKGSNMRELRQRLSFFRDGSVLQGTENRESDKAMLDSIFECRMSATSDLLHKEIAKARKLGTNVQALMISESSNNGVLEFDAKGNIEKDQPAKLNESRVYDEVKRGVGFYRNNMARFPAGLMFFTYQDEFDTGIKLHVGGAKNMPSVIHEITSIKLVEK
ncbi:hypothetical protein SAMN06295970_117119 [Noviherbaspirillum suwonense]|uniref:Uncharacterized protein n=2 Tax=Noviherbaspirillum suwonense TaxID=1224511 RepID=A0ABY1QK15_9BURK|nr:hypothetical protein SAMN06295970_117119 [Noviherbaspirillum suwonense]